MKTLRDDKSKFTFACIAVITLFFAIAFGSINHNNEIQLGSAQQVGNERNVNVTKLTLPELFSKVEGSVVQVSTTANRENGEFLPSDKSALGSGFVYDKKGHIITNYHVVASTLSSANRVVSSNNVPEIRITFLDGSVYNAKVISSDPFSDLAVLKLEGDRIPYDKLLPLPVGDSTSLRIGEQVVAIGNPFGLSGSMTEGIISGLGRMIPSSSERSPDDTMPPEAQSHSTYSIPDIIQTDAPINPGNSGGPLLNMKGEVIAINTAIFSTTGASAGIGFAIPSNTIKKVVPSLIATGAYQHPYIGIMGTDITPEIADVLGLEETRGFLVTKVVEGGPAQIGGLLGGEGILLTASGEREIKVEGDVIVKVDDKTVRKIDDILTYLEREKNVGDTVQFTVLRNGGTENININLTLGPRPNQQQIETQS
ncbi:MAG: trypsin-like peptidase domain-containing protein [Nitrososphaeraceae archaeon]